MTIPEHTSDLDHRIVKLVRKFWEEHRMPLLLSRLGNQYDGEIGREAKKQAGGLAAYMRRQLTEHVQVIQHSSKPPLIGAIPTDVDTGTNGDFDGLLDQTCGPMATQSVQHFHPAFRAAFRKPLDESKRRYMSIQAPLRFRDVSPGDRPDGFIEIEQEYVVGADADLAEAQQTMQGWFDENGLDPTSFLMTGKSQTAHLPADDLLGRLLLTLDPDDLKRLSMPLDIVSKLRRQSL